MKAALEVDVHDIEMDGHYIEVCIHDKEMSVHGIYRGGCL